MGRGHSPLEPNYYLGEEEYEADGWETGEDGHHSGEDD